jgi:hypothetical protein
VQRPPRDRCPERRPQATVPARVRTSRRLARGGGGHRRRLDRQSLRRPGQHQRRRGFSGSTAWGSTFENETFEAGTSSSLHGPT